ARKQNRHVTAGFAAHQIGGNDRGVSSGLVHVPAKFWQESSNVRFHKDLPILAAQLSREACRNGRIIEGVLAFSVFLGKRYGVGAKRFRRSPRGNCNDAG